MGTRKDRERLEDLWVAHADKTNAPGRLFYVQLNELLEAENLDAFFKSRCAKLIRQVRTFVADAGDLLSLAD